ncbi:hypothetical protein FM109_10440 [Vibrio casei]|nr:hypothetical protein FM109_10440 [Vibrio casei]
MNEAIIISSLVTEVNKSGQQNFIFKYEEYKIKDKGYCLLQRIQ